VSPLTFCSKSGDHAVLLLTKKKKEGRNEKRAPKATVASRSDSTDVMQRIPFELHLFSPNEGHLQVHHLEVMVGCCLDVAEILP
jgi:hypothetical protein